MQLVLIRPTPTKEYAPLASSHVPPASAEPSAARVASKIIPSLTPPASLDALRQVIFKMAVPVWPAHPTASNAPLRSAAPSAKPTIFPIRETVSVNALPQFLSSSIRPALLAQHNAPHARIVLMSVWYALWAIFHTRTPVSLSAPLGITLTQWKPNAKTTSLPRSISSRS